MTRIVNTSLALMSVRPNSNSQEGTSSTTFGFRPKILQHTLKAVTLRDVADVRAAKEDVKKGMIVIMKITPLAQKNVGELRKAVEDICIVAKSSGAEIARLGEERIIVTPPSVKIWRTSTI